MDDYTRPLTNSIQLTGCPCWCSRISSDCRMTLTSSLLTSVMCVTPSSLAPLTRDLTSAGSSSRRRHGENSQGLSSSTTVSKSTNGDVDLAVHGRSKTTVITSVITIEVVAVDDVMTTARIKHTNYVPPYDLHHAHIALTQERFKSGRVIHTCMMKRRHVYTTTGT